MIVEGYVSGQHKPALTTASPSNSPSTASTCAGDDIRHVDWKVWSKTDKFYLKQYEQETNLLTYLLLDTSESMGYASGSNVTKLQYSPSSSRRRSAIMVLQPAGLGRPGDCSTTRVRKYLKTVGTAVAPEGDCSTSWTSVPARESKTDIGHRSSTTWPSGSRSAGVVDHPLRLASTTSRADPRRAQAPPPPSPRGDRLPRPRPGRGRLPVPRHHDVQGPRGPGRRPRRPATRSARAYQAELRFVTSNELKKGLPG